MHTQTNQTVIDAQKHLVDRLKQDDKKINDNITNVRSESVNSKPNISLSMLKKRANSQNKKSRSSSTGAKSSKTNSISSLPSSLMSNNSCKDLKSDGFVESTKQKKKQQNLLNIETKNSEEIHTIKSNCSSSSDTIKDDNRENLNKLFNVKEEMTKAKTCKENNLVTDKLISVIMNQANKGEISVNSNIDQCNNNKNGKKKKNKKKNKNKLSNEQNYGVGVIKKYKNEDGEDDDDNDENDDINYEADHNDENDEENEDEMMIINEVYDVLKEKSQILNRKLDIESKSSGYKQSILNKKNFFSKLLNINYFNLF